MPKVVRHAPIRDCLGRRAGERFQRRRLVPVRVRSERGGMSTSALAGGLAAARRRTLTVLAAVRVLVRMFCPRAGRRRRLGLGGRLGRRGPLCRQTDTKGGGKGKSG